MPFSIRAHIQPGAESGASVEPPFARAIRGNALDAQQWLSDRIAELKEGAWANGDVEWHAELARVQTELALHRGVPFQGVDSHGIRYEIWKHEEG